MTLSELIDDLHEIQDILNDDTDPEIQMAVQPHYPLRHDLHGIKVDAPQDVLYFVAAAGHPAEGSPYGDKRLWDEGDWIIRDEEENEDEPA